MSSGITETLSIEQNKALSSEWEGQLLKLSMRKRLLQKYSANTITAIQAKYKPLKEEIRNKIDSLEENSASSEYTQLMQELRDLENKEETEIKAQEEAANDQEEEIQTEIDSLESRNEAIKKDTESLEELRKNNQEKSFGYFK